MNPSTALVLCHLNWLGGAMGWSHQHQILVVRSEAQCHSIARDRARHALGNARSYDLPRQQKRLDAVCGPELRDCEDWRNRN